MSITFRLAIFTVSCLLAGALAGPRYMGERQHSWRTLFYNKRAAAPGMDVRSTEPVVPVAIRSAAPVGPVAFHGSKRSAFTEDVALIKRSAAPSPYRVFTDEKDAQIKRS